MQQINLNKDIEFDNEIEDLLLISIDEHIDTIDDKDGVRIEGKISIGGKVKVLLEENSFSDVLDIDIFLSYDQIVERNSLSVTVNDFNYEIEGNKLKLNIIIKIEGLKEIETTFLAEENIEFVSKEEIIEGKKVYIDEEIVVEENRDDIQEKIEKIKANNNTCEIEEDKEDRNILDKEEIIIKKNVEEFDEPVCDNENKKSLIKKVFSNKRIKEEVSWKLHCVKEETSYEQIALKYNININDLININKNEKIEKGKLIFLPLK